MQATIQKWFPLVSTEWKQNDALFSHELSLIILIKKKKKKTNNKGISMKFEFSTNETFFFAAYLFQLS